MNTEPDGFLGAVLAAEGFPGMTALINGPGGCRSRAQILVRELTGTYEGEDPGCCRSKYFSRQTRLPCTYLNADDIIFGAGNKIAEGLCSVLSAAGQTDAVLVDTLGASVQVTDRRTAVERSGFAERTVLADPDLASLTCGEGFDRTVTAIVQHWRPVQGHRGRPAVNLLGYSYGDSGWSFGRQNLTGLIGLLGVDVIACPGCGSGKEEIAASGAADLNILIHPEYAADTAAWYSRELGIPTRVPAHGAPIGYPAIRSFLTETAAALGLDPAPALTAVTAEEQAVASILASSDKAAGSLHGYGMFLAGMPSTVLPLAEWLRDWFCLLPAGVVLTERAEAPHRPAVAAFLDGCGCGGALGRRDPPDCRAVLTDGFAAAAYHSANPETACLAIAPPYPDRAPFTDASLVGLGGARHLLDGLINGLRIFRCGQPTMADFR